MTTMTNEPRKRGRPTGSAVYLQRDRQTLSKFADKVVAERGLPLATFLNSERVNKSEYRRVQKRWQEDKDTYLREAQQRLDAGEPPGVLKALFEFFALLKNVDRHLGQAVKPIAESFKRQVARHERLTGGQNDIVPMFGSEAEAEAPIQRFEQHMKQTIPEEERGYSELTEAERLYRGSFLLFEMSMRLSQKHAGDEPND